jgi:tRNA threonylcarbamoyl adenosine modification protein (Sua5/YciO/YrdC/YwlC family)
MGLVDPHTAAEVLRAGNVVALPTDTVYGLAADASRPEAVELLFELKRRPRDVHIPELVADVDQARLVAVIAAPYVERLLARFWPGALTVVLDRVDGAGTVGVRCPDAAVVRSLCGQVGPLATTSANVHGSPPLTTAASVIETFGDSLAVVDGGVLAGLPSTVVDCTDGSGPVLLRAGAIDFTDILAAASVEPG